MSIRQRRARAPEYGRRVAAARARAGFDQAELAELVGVARGSINRIERGLASPNVTVALSIAAALGTTVDDLFGGDR